MKDMIITGICLAGLLIAGFVLGERHGAYSALEGAMQIMCADPDAESFSLRQRAAP